MGTAREKYARMVEQIRSHGRVVVAFSGGVDSTLLLYAAHEALGENTLAITAESPLFPERETVEARAFCSQHGIRQRLLPSPALELDAFRANPANRCYLCKRALYERVRAIAGEEGIDVILEGSNTDDDADYRPGRRALAEQGIHSPLHAAGMSKADIREVSRELGLPTWNKQSFACLASRFPTGTPITDEGLARVDDAEQFLLDRGFSQIRVRVHGDLARIEALPNDIARFVEPALRDAITQYFATVGFRYVALDLAGYRTGSMNAPDALS